MIPMISLMSPMRVCDLWPSAFAISDASCPIFIRALRWHFEVHLELPVVHEQKTMLQVLGDFRPVELAIAGSLDRRRFALHAPAGLLVAIVKFFLGHFHASFLQVKCAMSTGAYKMRRRSREAEDVTPQVKAVRREVHVLCPRGMELDDSVFRLEEEILHEAHLFPRGAASQKRNRNMIPRSQRHRCIGFRHRG